MASVWALSPGEGERLAGRAQGQACLDAPRRIARYPLDSHIPAECRDDTVDHRESLCWNRKRWGQKGLILWQKETQHIVRLFATYALQLLEDLHSDDAWTTQGIVVGEPVIQLTWGEQGNSSEPGLHNPIRLSPRQTRSLLDLLQRHRAALEELRRQEEEDRDRAMQELASILADIYIRSRARGSMPEDSSTG